MKIYVYTLTERNWWKDNWDTNITGVVGTKRAKNGEHNIG